MATKAKTRKTKRADVDNLTALDSDLRRLTFAMKRSMIGLRGWDQEDLVQEAYLRVMLKLKKFEGRSSFKTWVISLARNHLISLARAAALRPKPAGDAVKSNRSTKDQDALKQLELRTGTKRLLRWLKSPECDIDHAWEVFQLMLFNHGNVDYVSNALSIRTGNPWSNERVRNVVRAIRETAKGSALCEAVGLINRKGE